MPRRSRSIDRPVPVPAPVSTPEDRERGSASLEFIVVGLVLLVPLVYLVVTLGAIQAAALGAEATARHTARAIAGAADAADARTRTEAVVSAVAREYGLDLEAIKLETTCTPAATCPEPGALLTVTMRTRVVLPLVPDLLDLDRIASIPVEATAVQKISRTWGSP